MESFSLDLYFFLCFNLRSRDLIRCVSRGQKVLQCLRDTTSNPWVIPCRPRPLSHLLMWVTYLLVFVDNPRNTTVRTLAMLIVFKPGPHALRRRTQVTSSYPRSMSDAAESTCPQYGLSYLHRA
ncbi:hypothetical protein BJV74DRAFT_580147 [Russula compacta]|nr:hypothetical protein BJV74DRAFT_580147 [Russula compacta]